jgi:prepilin-type N-terminal cleavage/methylation domain-containing protein
MEPPAEQGFTLIELIIVVAIIAIIAALATAGLLRSRAAANEASAIASIRVTSSSQKAYAVSCGFGAYATGYAVLGATMERARPTSPPILDRSRRRRRRATASQPRLEPERGAGPVDCAGR